MLDGNVADIRKTYANTYQIFVDLYISSILLNLPYVVPGAIYLAKSAAPYYYYIIIAQFETHYYI